jgi:hypothetical protein
MCLSKYNLGYVMYDNEGKKYWCINMCKNTKVNNECKIYEKTKDRKRKKRRKIAKRCKYKTGNKPVKAVGKKTTKAIIALVYHMNREPDSVSKHKCACTVCTTQCVREYCTKVAHTPVSSGSKCKKEYVVKYIGMRSCMKTRIKLLLCKMQKKVRPMTKNTVWWWRMPRKHYVHWKNLVTAVDITKSNGGVEVCSMYSMARPGGRSA